MSGKIPRTSYPVPLTSAQMMGQQNTNSNNKHPQKTNKQTKNDPVDNSRIYRQTRNPVARQLINRQTHCSKTAGSDNDVRLFHHFMCPSLNVSTYSYTHFLMKREQGESLIRIKSSWELWASLHLSQYI